MCANCRYFYNLNAIELFRNNGSDTHCVWTTVNQVLS
jgi:hypothetical protein